MDIDFNLFIVVKYILIQVKTQKCKTYLIGGGGNPMGTSKSQNQGPWPPKPDTWDRYKVFCLKDHILSAKKKRGPSNITFSIFGYVGQLEATGRKRTSWLKTCLLNFCQLIWHYNPPDSIQSHPTPSRHLPDTLQTPSRHPTDTQKFSTFWPWEVTGRKGNSLIWWLLFNCLWFIWHLYSPDICQTPPDMIQTASDTHRHHPDTPQT